MVANAGIGGKGSILEGLLPDLAIFDICGLSINAADLAHWKLIWDVNTVGPLLCYKYGALQMVKQGFGGRIIGTFSHSFPLVYS
jgi:NAD(P)-dependent dehydrogenase (short-subunit alcohol dehydrogenase family)